MSHDSRRDRFVQQSRCPGVLSHPNRTVQVDFGGVSLPKERSRLAYRPYCLQQLCLYFARVHVEVRLVVLQRQQPTHADLGARWGWRTSPAFCLAPTAVVAQKALPALGIL